MTSLQPAPVLELVDRLVAGRPLNPERVERQTGIELHPVESANPYWAFFESKDVPPGTLAKIELRLRKSPPESGESLLVLVLGQGHSIPLEEVFAKHGRDPSLSVPPPHGPPDQLMYYVYPFAWGKLSFGAPRTKSGSVTQVVLTMKPED
jgi:hypothetical protein